MNKVILCGHLGKDPETKTVGIGNVVTEFSLATKGLKDSTDWHNIQTWGKTAELCGEYLSKGKQVIVEGRIKTDSYESNGSKRYFTRIIAERVEFIGSKSDTTTQESKPEINTRKINTDYSTEDIPF